MTFSESFPIVYAGDVERSLAFYRDLLDFELTYRWPDEGRIDFAYLRLGDTGIGISSASAPAELHGRAPVADSPVRFELCLYTDDTDAAAARMRAAGVRELRPPEDMPWGERLAYFEDPDGNPIHVAAKITP